MECMGCMSSINRERRHNNQRQGRRAEGAYGKHAGDLENVFVNTDRLCH
jgi:hypothetical protein